MKPCITSFMILVFCQVLPAGAGGRNCIDEAGKRHADILVEWCKAVSPATHPPCNTANSCDLIIDEIKRGCAFVRQEEASPYYCQLTYPRNYE